MKKFILLLPILLSSCAAVKGIFKAGWIVGLLCAVIVVIAVLIVVRSFKNKE